MSSSEEQEQRDHRACDTMAKMRFEDRAAIESCSGTEHTPESDGRDGDRTFCVEYIAGYHAIREIGDECEERLTR